VEKGSTEYYEMIAQFEKDYRKHGYRGRFDKESDHETIKNGYLYQDGDVNKAFQMWRLGYSCGRCTYINQ
jgi:hypothetical protein